jgi:hypothetical protein
VSAYAVDKVLRRLVIDAAFRETLRAEPTVTLAAARPPIAEPHREAFLAGDVGALSRAGANSWQLARFGLFGLDNDVYAERIRAAYTNERELLRAQGLLG